LGFADEEMGEIVRFLIILGSPRAFVDTGVLRGGGVVGEVVVEKRCPVCGDGGNVGVGGAEEIFEVQTCFVDGPGGGRRCWSIVLGVFPLVAEKKRRRIPVLSSMVVVRWELGYTPGICEPWGQLSLVCIQINSCTKLDPFSCGA